ncbi:putative asparagine--tRNA ligase, mitochondrial [Neolecta irregularis DAH-3]|uniref:asparagine--tRNA ligase n=1 Tax=Neolecta irregularis (strain DAH-3) TaxID=1198029 RepID=A0A1U7LQJ0_NEOID|nr:putative asparagine--tRNA ligase, mitochondrial [Neolecta irregularis DAH-3]|eukprot:OLL24940.1 putative asparagine--tRNA ligase, mitochondrial [Neolecta irregularis DAH-3]
MQTRCTFSTLPKTISQVISSSGSSVVKTNGWIRSIRRKKTVAFADLVDGTTSEPLQILLSQNEANQLSNGCSVELTGELKKSEGKLSRLEFHPINLKILGSSNAETYPMQKKYHTAGYLRQQAHLRSRTSLFSIILRLRSKITTQLHSFFSSNNFIHTHPPVITSSDCEGAGETFGIRPENFFSTSANLSVSCQLHLEALSMGVNRVWSLNPTFRAEGSVTSRHLAEFWMLEAEMSFIENLETVMSLVEGLIKNVTGKLIEDEAWKEFESVKGRENGTIVDTRDHWMRLMGEWKRISYADAIEILRSSSESFQFEPAWGLSLHSEHEKYLATNGPIFITDYPRSLKPFYMLASSSTTVAGFDLLFPTIGELAGGSLREHSYERLEQRMKEDGIDIPWYLELRKWGTVPRGGFGVGFERLLMFLVAQENVRDVISFPRWRGNCRF